MMTKLRDNLYVSGMESVTDERQLRAQGITAVLNVAFDVDDPLLDPTMIKMVKIGLADSGDNAESMKRLAIDTAKRLLSEGETLLVHCRAGQSRSVYVCVCALGEIEGKDWHDIFYEVKKMHPFALLGPLFHGENAKYYQTLESQEEQNGKA